MPFQITTHLQFNAKGRASCPACEVLKGKPNLNLALVPNTDGAYKCHRGCTPQEIRAAIGQETDKQIPTALAQAKSTPLTVSPQKVKEAHESLMNGQNSAAQARAWLLGRGFTPGLIARHSLGITRSKCGNSLLPAITIPLPNDDGTAYYQKKRVAPWLDSSELPAGYMPWSQKGIPARVWFTWLPAEAQETWICEGEWDAMLLGDALRAIDQPIAVCSFTCGCGNIPPQTELEKMPGQITIWYDRDEPGQKGAKKLAIALGDRAKIALVPMPDECSVKGWDVSNALTSGYDVRDFLRATEEAKKAIAPAASPSKRENPLRSRLISTDELVARAPEIVEWLLPDLLTANELFALVAPPRGGKTLWCMGLSRAVATGQNFLERPVTQGSVIYVNLEDSDAKVRERVEAQQWSDNLPIYWLDKFKLNEIEYLIEIADEMEDLRLIILDTLSRVRSDDKSENSAEMSFVLEPLQEFAKSRNVCVLLTHHTTKLNPDKTSLDEIFDLVRGNTAIRGTCRGSLVIAPGDNCYRLCAENGWGKHDLKIRIDGSKAEWKLLGRWSPQVNQDQKEIVLNHLNIVGSATIDEIAAETQLPKRSLYVVLDRLRADGMVEKIGSRKAATYQRPIQPIQQLNSLLNSSNEVVESDTAAIQQKKIISVSDSVVRIDQRNVSGLYKPLIDPHDLIDPTEIAPSVELPEEKPGEQESVSVSAIQQQFNSNSTVELETLIDPADLSIDQPISAIDAHNRSIKVGDLVEILSGQFAGKRANIESIDQDGFCKVKADGWYVYQLYPSIQLKRIRTSRRKSNN